MRRNEISCHSLGPLAKLISKRVIFRRTCARVKLHMNNARKHSKLFVCRDRPGEDSL